MVASGHIANLAENAIEKSIRLQLDVIALWRGNGQIKWHNLGIQNESDFLKGQLVAEILFEFERQVRSGKKEGPSHTDYLEAYKIIMGRADDIKRAITDIEFRSDTIK